MPSDQLYRDFQAGVARMEKHASSFEKLAFDPISMGVGYLASTGSLYGLQRLGKNQGAAFLRAGVELGRNGRKLSHNVANATQNLLGARSHLPYQKGLEIGQAMRRLGLSDEAAATHLQQIADETARSREAARRALELEGKLHTYQPSYADDALHDVAAGKGDSWFKNQLVKRSVPEEAPNKLVHDLVQASYTLPLAPLDKRMIARPVLRKLQGTPIGDKIEGLAQTNQITRKIRNFVD